MNLQEGQPSRAWAGRHEIALYLLLAYVISWSIWPLVLLNPASSPLVPFGPGLAAVVVASMAGGRRELFGLLGQLGRWRVDARWYVCALGISSAIPAAALGAAVVAGAQAPRWEISDLLQIAGAFLVTLVIVGLFEELGWRGFLLPCLQRNRTALVGALLVALAWLPWHLPELVSDPGQRPLPQFAIYIVALSVLFTWLYNSTQASLPIVMLAHAALNTFGKFFLSELDGTEKLVAWWTLAGSALLLAVAVVWYAGPRRLVREGARAEGQPVQAL